MPIPESRPRLLSVSGGQITAGAQLRIGKKKSYSRGSEQTFPGAVGPVMPASRPPIAKFPPPARGQEDSRHVAVKLGGVLPRLKNGAGGTGGERVQEACAGGYRTGAQEPEPKGGPNSPWKGRQRNLSLTLCPGREDKLRPSCCQNAPHVHHVWGLKGGREQLQCLLPWARAEKQLEGGDFWVLDLPRPSVSSSRSPRTGEDSFPESRH